MKVVTGKIYSFKLNSGEEVTGKLLEIVIESDAIPHYVVDELLGNGMTQKGVQLMPAMMTADIEGTTNVYISSVAMIKEPRDDVIDAYRESTTGIKVPDKKILLS